MYEDAGIVTGRHKGEFYDFRSSHIYLGIIFLFSLMLKNTCDFLN